MIGVDEARKQAATLKACANESPVRQYRWEMRRRGIEWVNRADELAAAGEDDGHPEAAIELVGAVGPGMRVFAGADGFLPVIRQMTRDGQLSLHLEGPTGQPRFLNFYGATSPVVVKW